MTVTNITIGADRSFAMVSAESFVAPATGAMPDARTSGDVAVEAEKIAAGRARAGRAPDVQPLAFATKIFALPHLHLVAMGAGFVAPVFAFAGALSATAPNVADARGVARDAPALLRSIKASFPTMPFMVMIVGWIPYERRIAGFAWASGEDFETKELGPGHTMQPAPYTSHHDYARLAEAWAPAIEGQDTEGFHRRLFANQLAACRAGKFGDGLVVGGKMQLARIDSCGISMKTIREDEF